MCALLYAASQSTLHETEANPTRNFSHDPIEHGTSDDFNKNDMRRPMEISLRMSLGAKRKGTSMLCEWNILYFHPLHFSWSFIKTKILFSCIIIKSKFQVNIVFSVRLSLLLFANFSSRLPPEFQKCAASLFQLLI